MKYGLLTLLADAPTHGYELKTGLERATGGSWSINVGQVYSTLARLERDGLVAATTEATDGATERRDYRITDIGRAELERWFEQPYVPDTAPRDELTAKVLLAVAAPDVDVRDLLQRQRTATIAVLQAYTRRKASADPDDLSMLLMLDALIFRAEAEVRWLDACDARIARRAATSYPDAADVARGRSLR
ncbi:MAG: PadR family transcriptional regulator [Chloroflexi bacterium]|nr:PadR family transcriptional regulator [Chloroflexota bacterium]